jgi:hypothetical protein
MNSPQGWHFQQVSDYGSAHPVVARTLIQGAPILEFFLLNDAGQEHLKERLYELQNQLVGCVEQRDAIAGEVEAALKLPPPAPGRVHQLPAVMNLQTRCESFLQSLKLAIRDSARMFEACYPGEGSFDHRFHKLKAWAERKFGPEDHTAKCIAHWEPWVAETVTWRNAVDHPREDQGEMLLTANIRVVEQNGALRLEQPHWKLLKHSDFVPIVPHMDRLIAATLRISEDFLVELFYKLRLPFPVELYEIPENERRPECPVRLRVTVGGLPPVR